MGDGVAGRIGGGHGDRGDQAEIESPDRSAVLGGRVLRARRCLDHHGVHGRVGDRRPEEAGRGEGRPDGGVVQEPDHDGGGVAGTDPADIERRAAIAEVLGKEVWPADRNTLVAKAEEANASDGVLAQLRRLPEGREYANVQDVAEALGLGTEQQRF